MIIKELTEINTCIDQLSGILIKVVNQGASIGFIPPFDDTLARQYWNQVTDTNTVLLAAEVNGEVLGTVQLVLSTKPNGLHRAEIAKLMVHPDHQGRGIGRLLMKKAEKAAIARNRTLIVLDTRKGDRSNHLYLSMGYNFAGEIPSYAMSADGNLDPTVLYYKIFD
ncbi:GNAT family N-acetyltransferase [Jeotgalibacillus sp. JSM ZJ347]|uniref:GNAT family N-acetyltransferase n=1 Tax=Jeotgalibacillus sp. JSM ZJ347 TaxID=3342117 RepID=UPI0035A98B21